MKQLFETFPLWRMKKSDGVFEITGVDAMALQIQYRMNQEICALANLITYKEFPLQNDESVVYKRTFRDSPSGYTCILFPFLLILLFAVLLGCSNKIRTLALLSSLMSLAPPHVVTVCLLVYQMFVFAVPHLDVPATDPREAMSLRNEGEAVFVERLVRVLDNAKRKVVRIDSQHDVQVGALFCFLKKQNAAVAENFDPS